MILKAKMRCERNLELGEHLESRSRRYKLLSQLRVALTSVGDLLSQSSPFGFDLQGDRSLELAVDIRIFGRPERDGDSVLRIEIKDSTRNWEQQLRSEGPVSLSVLPSIAVGDGRGRDEGQSTRMLRSL